MPDKKNTLTLESVCNDLFDIFETEITNGNGEEVIDRYLRGKTIEEELSGKIIQNSKYSKFSEIVKTEVLPLYQIYKERKNEIGRKKEKRSLTNYVVGTIAVLEVLEAIASRGASLRPMFIATTIFVEGGIGAGLYYAQNIMDNYKIGRAKEKFFKGAKRIEKQYLQEQRYDNFQNIMDGDLLQAESQSLLSKYDSPVSFWRDYAKVRSINPTSESAIRMTSVPAFDEFLEMHAKGAYSDVKIEKRFNDLFIKAHEYFLSQDRKKYAMDYTMKII